MIGGLLWAVTAWAGPGPWILEPGEHDVYLGAETGRFRRVGTSGGPIKLGTALHTAQLSGVWTVGLAKAVDLQVLVPVEAAWVADPDAGFCVSDRPEAWCAPTSGLGDVAARLQLRLLDERSYRPVTVSLRASARTGAAYAGRRTRFTTLGDGQTDLGAGLAIGRGGSRGDHWYRVAAAGQYWLRLGVGQIDGRKVPADEIGFGTDLMASPVRWIGLGAAVSGFHRLRGLPLAQADIDGPLNWVSLAATHVRAGPQVALYTESRWTVFSTVQVSVYARNTPSDGVSVTIGVGRSFRRREPSPPADWASPSAQAGADAAESNLCLSATDSC